jgi:hypothetical protein
MILSISPKSLLVFALALTLAPTAPLTQAGQCQCACSVYFEMLETIDEYSKQWPAKLDRCAGACANAWARCEIHHEIPKRLSAIEPGNAESVDDEKESADRENHRPTH